MSKHSLMAFLGLLAVFGTAQAAPVANNDDLGFDNGPAPQPALVESTGNGDTVVAIDEKTVQTVVQSAAQAWEVGGKNVFVVDLMAGTMTGLRIKVIPWAGERVHVAIEGIVAAAANGAGLGAEYGGGARVEFVVASDHKYNALYISPGVDFLVMPAGSSSQFLNFGPYSNVYLLSASADISWVHQFSPHFSWQVIGAHLGVGVGLGGETSSQASAAGMLLPEVSLFTGFRF